MVSFFTSVDSIVKMGKKSFNPKRKPLTTKGTKELHEEHKGL